MNARRVFILGTMIVTMSFAGTAWGKSAITPIPMPKWSIVDLENSSENEDDEFLSALNQSSEEEVADKLYRGHSLRSIAQSNGGDYDKVIALQIRQLQAQLDERLASGSISSEQHSLQSMEITQLITDSANKAYISSDFKL
ncbi:hypothetical protein HUB98_27000 [Paenibacillus barcinonensis]|uniref:Uncharacterized protein n=1 Tax=Paenibacillus barcinonensis TaxID=198119 RepID=A0A2V4W1W2_PAEBA|nr:hypothetical protein [Paenibacillus barcinonensis]PYE52393.1 hypothetical protein DFQ00_101329 [Paenibacillus barcinonensis]QKS59495.1 hypothetical protein HUB98_27000 [Paenibacillus barcinonensis]